MENEFFKNFIEIIFKSHANSMALIETLIPDDKKDEFKKLASLHFEKIKNDMSSLTQD